MAENSKHFPASTLQFLFQLMNVSFWGFTLKKKKSVLTHKEENLPTSKFIETYLRDSVK